MDFLLLISTNKCLKKLITGDFCLFINSADNGNLLGHVFYYFNKTHPD